MEVQLRDVIRIKHGFAFKGEFFTDEETGLALLTPGNFTLSGGFQETKKFYASTDFPEEFILSTGDLIVTMTDLSKEADTIGYSALVPENEHHKYLHNQRIGLVTVYNSDFEKDFIYWLMRSPHYQRTIASSSNGATVHHTSPERIYNYRFEKKEKNTQQKIADILSAYDNLIEVNNKRIKVLEQMAENLYKEWFVRFRFPGYKSAEFENGIPKGWEECRFSSIANILSGGTPSTEHEEYYGGNIPFYTPKDSTDNYYVFDTITNLTENGLQHCNSQLFLKNTIMITARGTVGNLNLLAKPMAMNQSCYALTSNNIPSQFFLFFLIKREIHKLKKMASGGVFDTIIVNTFDHIKVPVPDKKLIILFDKKVTPIMDEVYSLLEQNRNLIRQRDLLLPRLMNGKLEV